MKRLPVLLVGLLLPLIAVAQQPVSGNLLVATAALDDPTFIETVVLLVHYGEDGALGIFLNRPTWVDGADVNPELQPLNERTRAVYFGGPVAMTRILALHNRDLESENTTRILDSVYMTADLSLLADQELDKVRFYAGHATWAPAQLQAEIDNRFWHVADANADLVFHADPREIWELATASAEAELTVGIRNTGR